MTDAKLLEASEAYEDERRRWTVRRNKANAAGEQWEVLQTAADGQPISDSTMTVHAKCYDQEVATHEMETMRGVAAIGAALEVVNA